jgi:7-cyano-7-deazaguanine reductase
MANLITQLGRKSVLTDKQVREPRSILEAFDNPRPERNYEIEFSFPEFTSVCPVTGQPDFATILVNYIPDRLCVEMKSLKLYFFSYRNKGIFYESVVNTILDDLVAVLRPRYMRVTGRFAVRGGTAGTVTAEHQGGKGRAGARTSGRKAGGKKPVQGNGQAGGRTRGTRSRG